MRCCFLGKGPCKTDHAGFGSTVVGKPGCTFVGELRSHIDYAAPTPWLHSDVGQLRQQEGGAQMHRQHPFKRFHCRILDQHLLADPGIVDDNVDASECFFGFSEEGTRGGYVTDVALPGEPPAAGGVYVGEYAGAAGLIVDVTEGDVASFDGKGLCDGCTDAAAAAGDKRSSRFKTPWPFHRSSHVNAPGQNFRALN